MRILIVSDAWTPQVNGVVRTLQSVSSELDLMGHQVGFITPDQYRSFPCPTYPEIRLAMTRSKTVGERIVAFQPSAIHLSTEGPLCLAARRWCINNKVPFTTAYHTQFPDYVAKRTGLPPKAIWPYIRWFHAPATAVLVSTPQIREELRTHGIRHLAHWGRGVDTELFRPDGPTHPQMDQLTGPIQLYVGRVAVEKNIETFLTTNTPGTKVVVGDGPALESLKRDHPNVLFLGALSGAELAAAYRTADVFVFPSLTDTFGLVMIEALASGVPVAAFPVSGPIDIITPTTGVLNANLADAIEDALHLHPDDCVGLARQYSWRSSAQQFLSALAPVPSKAFY